MKPFRFKRKEEMCDARIVRKKMNMIMFKQERLLWNSRIPGGCECKEFGVLFQVLAQMERKCVVNGEGEGSIESGSCAE